MDEDLPGALAEAARGRDDEVGELLRAAADRITEQENEIGEIRGELEDTNEGMVALTLELEAAERRYRSLFESAVEGIYKTTPEADRYVMANSSMADIYGYDDPAALTDAVGDIREDVFVDGERYDEYRDRLRSNGRIENFEYRIRRADGEVRWVSDNARTLEDDDGSPPGFRGGVIDITERKRYEDRLETRTEELEALTRMLRHDIANDMQVIRAFGEHLRENVAEDHRSPARKIVKTADHVLQLTEEARTFVEAVTGGEDIDLEPVSLVETLEYAVERQRDTYPEATVEVGPIPDVEVTANEMLSSVFRNLLTNAVTHHDTGEPTIQIRAEHRGECVELRFVDDGPGVPDERKDEIFGKGNQSVDSEGTGIGLYLVTKLTANYGGDVRVEDRADGEDGAAFVVELPTA